ncbi:hypothetical protein SETIT_5G360000v2 [Setaria italica]|uniref:Uncharacterized protein n=1 Tax=Setaria italica TaxID=4555 RepID=A0A368RCS3_SETIT|nr:hypothetical protein SETIT_5G360000v2 [Setaria italica]
MFATDTHRTGDRIRDRERRPKAEGGCGRRVASGCDVLPLLHILDPTARAVSSNPLALAPYRPLIQSDPPSIPPAARCPPPCPRSPRPTRGSSGRTTSHQRHCNLCLDVAPPPPPPRSRLPDGHPGG